MGHGVESCRRPNSEHAGECMETSPSYNDMERVVEFQTQSPEESVMGETEYEVVRENSLVVSNSKSSTAASEIVFEAGNFTVVSKSSSHGSNSSGLHHVCRFCSRVFSSGKALGGHVRIHGAGRSKRHSSSSGNVSRGDYGGPEDVWVKKSKVPTSRSDRDSNWVEALSIAGEGEEAEEQKEAKNMSVSGEQKELSDQKTVSLYTLRRNPKRSRRLIDEEFSMDLTAKNTVACVECGKEFPSSKALFGHMRCHPERDWRGIQLPNDSHCNTTGGDIVVHAAAPSSGLSSVCWQSSQGSEDVEEKGKYEVASDNGSDRESMQSTRVTHQPASCSLFSWSVTAKRGRRRPIRFTQPKEEDTGEEEETDVDTTKELEDDRDTAHFLVMLASCASNTNNTNGANRQVERQMPGESVYHSKRRKRESQGSFEASEAGQEDLGWKEKVKKRTAKTSRLAELGAGFAGKYECSTCKKLFNTRRAMRSHKSSHKKVKDGSAIEKLTEEEITAKGNSALMIEYHPAAVNDMDSSPAREEKKRANLTHLTEERSLELAIHVEKDRGHLCCICHKVFLSGQALGGHKRCHRTADRVTERANSVTSSEKKAKLLRDQVRQPLFDLNQPAQAEEDDLEAAYAMVEVVPADVVTINAGFRYVECNICGVLCTSIDGLRTHQITHA